METVDKRPRLLYIDNIRWSMIILVVIIHANVIYGPVGQFFDAKDRSTAGDASDIAFMTMSILFQTFFMGLLFLIAGYFVSGSLERKGTRVFVKERFMRLVVPSLVFIFFLAPAITYPLHVSDDMSLAEYLVRYLPNPLNWDSGPMWFAIALFVFSGVFALAPGSRIWKLSFPKLSKKLVLGLMLIIGAGTFLVRIPFPINTDVWNMQLCFFTQYVVFFVVGVLAYRNKWLESLTKQDGRFWLIVAVASFFLLMLPSMALGGALDDELDPFYGGLQWQAAVLAVWEQIFGVGISIWLLVWYRERHNSQSWLRKKLSDNSFSVYLFHPPFIIIIGYLLLETGLPAFAKFLIVAAGTLAVTFTLSELVFRRIPGLKRIL